MVHFTRKNSFKSKTNFFTKYIIAGLPHTQGIKGNSGNFQVIENLWETEGTLVYFLNSKKLRK